jgi:eukaryotic-like serine/threonine-protein kinase
MSRQYPSMDVRPGDIVANNYRVEAILSRERGMLLEARHTEFDQRVVIRLLAPIACSERDVEGFRREIRTLAKLESEHVARILDVGEHSDGSLFLVREHVHGSSLDDIVVGGPLAVSQAVDCVLELGEAIQEAHSHGVVLRDLRPEHAVLSTRRGGEPRAKLVDFGTAKLIGEQAGPEATAVLVGSPYASPELLRSPTGVDTRTDVWSLGCILYFLLTGRAPFAGAGPQLMLAIAKGEPTALRELRHDLPAELEPIIGWALAKQADKRFSTVYALAHALRPFASPAGNVIVDRIGRLAEVAKAGPPPAPVSSPRQPRTLSRRGADDGRVSNPGHSERPSRPLSESPPAMWSSPSYPEPAITQPPPAPESYASAPAALPSYEPSFDAGFEPDYDIGYDSDAPGASPSIPAVAASLPSAALTTKKSSLGMGALAALCACLVVAPAITLGILFGAPGLTQAGSATTHMAAVSYEIARTATAPAPKAPIAKPVTKPAAPATKAAPAKVAAKTAPAAPRYSVSSAPRDDVGSRKSKKSKKKSKASSSKKGATIVALVLGGKCSMAIDGRSFGKTKSASMAVSPGSHSVTCDGQSRSVTVKPGGRGIATFRKKK